MSWSHSEYPYPADLFVAAYLSVAAYLFVAADLIGFADLSVVVAAAAAAAIDDMGAVDIEVNVNKILF